MTGINMNPTTTIRSALYALSIVAASIGVFVYWQISRYPEAFNNIAFVFAYAVMLILISMPLFVSETISGFLSKKPLTGSLHFAARSQRLRFIGLLSMVLAAILLIMVIARISVTSSSLVYTSFWYTTHSAEKTLHLIDNYTLLIGIIFSAIIVIIIGFSQTRERFLKLSSAFATLGLACLIGLFIMNAVTFNTSLTTGTFFTPDFHLLASIDVWESALSLSLFSGLIGLGVNSVLGTYFNAQCSIRRFSWSFVIGSIITVIIIMLIQSLYTNSSRSASDVLGFQYAYTLNLLAFGMFFFCLLTTAILLCQTFKGLNTSTTKHKWYVYLPFFILLLAASIIYQHVLAYTVHDILQSNVIIILILFIAYLEILIFGWICDAQKLSYQLHKATKIKLSALYNLSLRLIAPSAILAVFTHKILSIFVTMHWFSIVGIFILSLIFTVILGSFLHRKFQ
ncbi:hypothetical protein [Cysteiniphilum marinum]|uniref:hypothetical protein n=2 Tax=Fastidiosibacteraceae TaxID=2056687 RepID=UPI0019393EFA|nr:hypothetical protein [Cysteiniphilum marinum]